MKCSRCEAEIQKKEPLIILYIRGSNGSKADCVLCNKCIYKFGEFMNPEKSELLVN